MVESNHGGRVGGDSPKRLLQKGGPGNAPQRMNSSGSDLGSDSCPAIDSDSDSNSGSAPSASSFAKLPVEAALPQLREALAGFGAAVLVAPPGAGKTTRVPPALLDEPWLQGRRILMLEPRRLAARAAARFMAAALGDRVGGRVGYRVRMDTRVSERTRIEVITEGVLTRMLQEDPMLEGVGAVIFDEFHERSLHADLGLALCMHSRSLLREDLRILVMSATLEAEPVSRLMGGAPILISEGRQYPVDTRYAARPVEGSLEAAMTRTIMEALTDAPEGDVLAFLPGAPEIRRTQQRLGEALRGRFGHVKVEPLYGTLPQEAQDRALAPAAPGERKVVLATSIAETSLTVEGVRIVVDGGWSRVPRFSPRTGMTRLETVKVARASADQRRGRAGRQGPGVCYRLWTEQEDRTLSPRQAPELLEADLAPLVLELAAWGAAPSELAWLDAPPGPAWAQAAELLQSLGALDATGGITPHGRRMGSLGPHPRLAHMMVCGAALGLGELACDLAAILGERDFLRLEQRPPGAAADADLRLRLDAVVAGGAAGSPGRPERRSTGSLASFGLTADEAAVRRIRGEAAQWKRELELLGVQTANTGGSSTHSASANGSRAGGSTSSAQRHPDEACGLLLAFAYPDRIGAARGAGRFLLRNGRGAVFPAGQSLAAAPLIVAAELDDQGAESRIYLAAPLTLEQLEAHLPEQLEEEAAVWWDRDAGAVRARRRLRLGALTLRDAPLPAPPAEACRAALLQGLAEAGLRRLPWTKAAKQLRERMAFMRHADPAWPDVSDEALLATLPEWLGPYVDGFRSLADLEKLRLTEILESLLDWNRRRLLDSEAPTHLTVPSGSRHPVDYSDPENPALSVRLQELFGLPATPRIGGGRIPIVLHLLSPAQRPVQVTRDLASFWRTTYFEVKKDLKGRYPKHYWPEDPMEAVPTARVRPRPNA